MIKVYKPILLALFCSISVIYAKKPNVLMIVMDDFGIGHFSHTTKNLQVEDMDPVLVDFVSRHSDYGPQEALEFSRRATPTLAKLAEEGTYFKNAYTSSPLCGPARLGILTAKHPNSVGIYRNSDMERKGVTKGVVLVERLQKAGYKTALIGKYHLGSKDTELIENFKKAEGLPEDLNFWQLKGKYPHLKEKVDALGYLGSCKVPQHPLNNGFDYYYGYNMWESPFYNAKNIWENFNYLGNQKEYNTETFTGKAIKFIEESAQEKKPFYVHLSYHAVHAPLEPKAPDEYYNKFESSSFTLNNFYAHVNAVDEGIKEILNKLESLGLKEDTIIGFVSDNGAETRKVTALPANAPHRGHKGHYINGGLKVPMFIHYPKGGVRGKDVAENVSSLDLLPTVFGFTDVNLPNDLDGVSLKPFITGETLEPPHSSLIMAGLHATKWGHTKEDSVLERNAESHKAPGAWTVLKGKYKLLFIGTVDEGLYHSMMEGKSSEYFLYDLSEDPQEKRNLFAEKPEIAREMMNRYRDYASTLPEPIAWDKKYWDELILK